MAGLSIGSCVALETARRNLDLFDTIGVFGGPPLGNDDDVGSGARVEEGTRRGGV